MRQQYIIFAISLLTAGILITACSDDIAPYGEKNAQNSQLNVSKDKVTFDIERSATVKVTTSTGLEWEVFRSAGWISINKLNGTGSSDITISTSTDNPSTTTRTSYVTVSSKRYGLQKKIAVEQQGSYLTLSKSNLDFPTSGGSLQLTVESNVLWIVSSKPSWITTNTEAGEHGTTSVTISAQANKSANERQGEVVISAMNSENRQYLINRTIKVLQTPISLAVSQTALSVNPAGGSLSFNVTSNTEWTATSNVSWCKVNTTSGTGNKTVNITVTENNGTNDRTATITITAGNVTRTVWITQSTATLSIDKSNITFGPAANTQVVNITSNTSWTATSNANWCVVTAYASSISLSVAANNTTSQRTATITVKAGGVTKTVTVKQEAPSLSLSQSEIAFAPENGQATFNVISNAEWTATSNADWCKLSTSSGTGNKAIDVNVTTNNGTALRTATITVKVSGLTKTITVKQAAPTLSLSPSTIAFTPDYNIKTLSITTNTTWTATSNTNWCKLNKSSGTGNQNISVTASSNYGTTTRTATITVKAGSLSKTVTITQDFFVLSVSPSNVQFPLQESTVALAINTNTSWNISDIPTQWCTVTPTSGTGNATVTIKNKAASSSTSREATLTVIAGNLEKKITLKQNGVTLSISSTELAFEKGGGTKTITATSNATVTASSNATSWCTVSVSGSTLTIMTTPNTTINTRTATITVKAAGLTRYVTVNQAGGTTFDVDDYPDDTNMN